MSKKKYAVYTRDECGLLTRHHGYEEVFLEEHVKLNFPVVEGLLGWPESSVRWVRETGFSIGLAEIGC